MFAKGGTQCHPFLYKMENMNTTHRTPLELPRNGKPTSTPPMCETIPICIKEAVKVRVPNTALPANEMLQRGHRIVATK